MPGAELIDLGLLQKLISIALPERRIHKLSRLRRGGVFKAEAAVILKTVVGGGIVPGAYGVEELPHRRLRVTVSLGVDGAVLAAIGAEHRGKARQHQRQHRKRGLDAPLVITQNEGRGG